MAEQQVDRSVSAEELVDFFTAKFSQQYGTGHLVLACHAAFPVSITVDLLYQTWANFKTYTDSRGIVQTIPMLAVSDVLLSSLFRPTGRDLYEMWPPVRARLLDKLKADFGEERLKSLARFLQLYVDQLPNRPEWKNFREAQQWTALMVTDPGRATRSLLQSLIDSVGRSQVNASIGISNMIEAFASNDPSFMRDLSKHLQSDTPTANTPAVNDPTSKRLVITDQAVPGKPAFTLPSYISQRLQGNQPLMSTITERQKNSAPGRIWSVSIGITDYENKKKSSSSINEDAKRFSDFLNGRFKPEQHIELYQRKATRSAIIAAIGGAAHNAGPNDIVIIYFSGHAQNTTGVNAFLCAGDSDIGSPDRMITDNELRSTLTANAHNDPSIVVILDTSTGSRRWLEESNPRHIQLMASHLKEYGYTNIDIGGIFTSTILQAFESNGGRITYRQLYAQVLSAMHRQEGTDLVNQTPLFVTTGSNWDRYAFTNEQSNTIQPIQQLLNECNYPVTADGMDGPLTREAIRRFMQDHQVREEGKVRHYLKLKSVCIENSYIPVLLLTSGPKRAIDKLFEDDDNFNLVKHSITGLYNIKPSEKKEIQSNPGELKMRTDLEEAAVIILALEAKDPAQPEFIEEVYRILDMAFALDKEVLVLLGAETAVYLAGGRYASIVWSSPDYARGEPDPLEHTRKFKTFLEGFLEKESEGNLDERIAYRIHQAREDHILDLSKQTLIAIPEEVYTITGLKELYLEGNEISELPAQISQLSDLEVLNLNGNPIRKLPHITALRKLRILALDNTELEELPESIGELQALEELRVHGTPLSIIPLSAASIQTLKVLDARECRILNIPKKFLTHKNAPTRLRNYFKDWQERIDDNGLFLIGDERADTANIVSMLDEWFGAGNQNRWSKADKVTDAPALFATLWRGARIHPAFIYIVDKNGGLFEEFRGDQPENFIRTLSLFIQHLHIPPVHLFYEGTVASQDFCNNCVQVPGIQSMIACVSSGHIENFPENFFQQLFLGRTIDESYRLAMNQYRQAPVDDIFPYQLYKSSDYIEFSLTPELTRAEPPFTLHRAENTYRSLIQDGRLDLSKQQLKEVPREVFELTELTSLNISDCPITAIPDAIANLINLKEFIAERIPGLTALPEAFYKLTKLEEISIASSGIRWLSRSIAQLKELRTLSMAFTNIRTLPIELATLPSLTYVYAGNKQFINISQEALDNYSGAALKRYFTTLPKANPIPRIFHCSNGPQPNPFSEALRSAKRPGTLYSLSTIKNPKLDLREIMTTVRAEVNQQTLLVLDDHNGQWSREFGEAPAKYHNIYQYFASFVFPINVIYNGVLGDDQVMTDLVTAGTINSFVIAGKEEVQQGLPALLAELMIYSGQSYLQALQFIDSYNRPFGYDLYYNAQHFRDFTLLGKEGMTGLADPEKIVATSKYIPAASVAPKKATPKKKTAPKKDAPKKKPVSASSKKVKRTPQSKHTSAPKKRKGPTKKK